jgi:hypothetical protein
MFGPDHDIRLPWQFVLLAFLAFAGLFVGIMVYFSYADSSGMSGSMVRGLRAFGIPYLVCVALATPALVAGGRRTMGKWREAEGEYERRTAEANQARAAGAFRPYESAPAGRVRVPVSREKGLVVSLIALIAGIGMTLHSMSQAQPGGRYFVYWGLMGVGAAGVLVHLLRRE